MGRIFGRCNQKIKIDKDQMILQESPLSCFLESNHRVISVISHLTDRNLGGRQKWNKRLVPIDTEFAH